MREKFKNEFRNKFRKIVGIVGSALLVGSTVGFAMAAGGGFPTPFVENDTADYAIVVGASAAASDMTGANSIDAYLKTFYTVEDSDSDSDSSTITGDFSNAVGVVEDEIELGSSITSTLRDSFTDSKIPTLLDTEVSWDDGVDSKRYDVHEEIHILNDGMVLQTTLDDSELEDNVVLENKKALQYKYVFDDVLTIDRVGHIDADELFLTILGKEYEVLDMEDNSITVSFSDEKVVKSGDNVVVDGVTLTIGDIFLGSVEVNGVLVKEGRTRTINGVEVFIDTIAYHSYSDLPSKAIIKVGKDISQTITSGDEYTDDDETWVWDIANLGTVGGYIGVTYDINSVSYDEDEDENNAISVGQSYALPENYGAVVFEGLTDVDYEDFELSFDDRDLWYNVGVDKHDDEDVAVLEGENDDSITLTSGGMSIETDSIYFRYNGTANELYFKDIDGDVDDDHEGRIQLAVNPSNLKVVVGDTEMDVVYDISSVTLTNSEEAIVIALGNDGVDFDRLGSKDEDAESTDVIVNGTSVGVREDDVFTHYGLFIRDPEDNADNDRVTMSIPNSQVFAKFSVRGLGMAVEISGDTTTNGNETEVVDTTTSVPEVGKMIFTDTETGWQNRNVILVGGSCINSATAQLLGGTACGVDFTTKTGIGDGQYLIQAFASLQNSEKIAVIISGYRAEDTSRGISDFIARDTDFNVIGTRFVG